MGGEEEEEEGEEERAGETNHASATMVPMTTRTMISR